MKFSITVLLFLCFVYASGQSKKNHIIFNAKNLFAYENADKTTVHSFMIKNGWKFLRNVSDSKFGVEYIMWGNPNKSNKYDSEIFSIGFKSGASNIVMYCNDNLDFYNHSTHDVYGYGYSLKSRDQYKDADISIYENKNKRLVMLVKPKTKEGITYTIYTYIWCEERQLKTLNFSAL